MAHENDRIGNNFGTTGIGVFLSKLEHYIVKDLYCVTISTKLIVNVIDLTSTQYKHCYKVLAYD